MTSVTIERFGWDVAERDARALEAACQDAADELAGRTVWCAAALPGGRSAALRLRDALEWSGGPPVAVAWLEVAADEPIEEVARRLDELLFDGTAGPVAPAEAEVYAAGADAAERGAGAPVRPDDVVVLHDALAGIVARALRERGAHTVWSVRPGIERTGAAWAFLQAQAPDVDAYLETRRGGLAARMPSSDAVAAFDLAPGDRYANAGWSRMLADVVHADRLEHVGGRRHARPAVAPR